MAGSSLVPTEASDELCRPYEADRRDRQAGLLEGLAERAAARCERVEELIERR